MNAVDGGKEGVICVFGEVLFDLFPDGHRVLGGAPFNVAWHLQAFGQNPCFISRVGDDDEGRAIRAAMADWGMRLEGLQTDGERPTGRVTVVLEDGEPAYDIVPNAAYDAVSEEHPATGFCKLLYHGSLALRGETTRKAFSRIKSERPSSVFMDVNLRDPWWNREDVLAMVHEADWVKLNEAELNRLSPLKGDPVRQAEDFLGRYRLRGLVVTRGEEGALGLDGSGEAFEVAPPGTARVIDTVGAGDAFSSVMILGITLEWPIRLMLERAQAFASRLVGCRGATVRDPEFYRPFNVDWKLVSAERSDRF